MSLASNGNDLVRFGIIGLGICVPGLVLSSLLMQRGSRAAVRVVSKGRREASQMLAGGASPEEVAAALVTTMGLRPGVAVRVLIGELQISPREAIEILRPHLTARQQDLFDRMPTSKLDALFREYAP